MAECSGRWTEELRKFQGGGERDREREVERKREERRDEQDESEVMCLDPQADSCHFCLPGTPLHFVNSVVLSVRDHTTPVPYRLGIQTSEAH